MKDLAEKDGHWLRAAAESRNRSRPDQIAEEIAMKVERHGFARYRF